MLGSHIWMLMIQGCLGVLYQISGQCHEHIAGSQWSIPLVVELQARSVHGAVTIVSRQFNSSCQDSFCMNGQTQSRTHMLTNHTVSYMQAHGAAARQQGLGEAAGGPQPGVGRDHNCEACYR